MLWVWLSEENEQDLSSEAGSVLPPHGGLKPRTGSGGNFTNVAKLLVKATLIWLGCVLYLNVASNH